MKRYVATLLACGSLGVAVLIGCAEGSDSDPTVGLLAATPVEAGADDQEEKIKLPPPSNPPDQTSDPKADAGSSGSSGKPGGADAGGGTGGPSGGGSACDSPNACGGSTDLGSVSGDTGADVRTADGASSQWLKVHVTEDDSGFTGVPLWMTATLVSPPGTNFDLYVYVPDSDTIECSAVTAQSTSTSSTDSKQVKFGELSLLANGASDSRTVTIEVRHVSGPCDPSAKWTLKVEGNK